MPPLSVSDFQHAISTTNLGFVDVGQDGKLATHNTHKTLTFLNTAQTDVARNNAVRNALITALTDDAGNNSVYCEQLKRELLGAHSEEMLTRDTVKKMLDRHVTLKGALTGEPGKIEGVRLSNVNGEADALVKFAAYDATNVSIATGDDVRLALEEALRTLKMEAYGRDLGNIECVENAEKKLTAFYALKGRDFVDEKGNAVPGGLDKITDCMKALATLEEFLQTVNNALARHDKEQPPELRTALDFCASRLAELEVIYRQVDVAHKEYAPVTDQQGMLLSGDRTVREVMVNLAAQMHGADDLAHILNAKTTALTEKINALTSSEKNVPDPVAVGAARLELERLAAYVKAAEEGVTIKGASGEGSTIHLEGTMIKGLKARVETLKTQIDNFMGNAQAPTSYYRSEARQVLNDVLDWRNPAFLSGPFAEPANVLFAQLTKMIKDGASFNKVDYDKFVNQMALQKEMAKHTLEKLVQLKVISPEEAKEMEMPFVLCSTKKVAVAFHRLHDLKEKILGDNPLGENKNNGDDGFKRIAPDSATWKKFFNGEVGLGTVMGASIHGFSGDIVDARLDDQFLTSKRKLGSGAANTVYEVTYSVDDGKGGTESLTRVFKPENTAMSGLMYLLVGSAGYSSNTNRAAYINRASMQAAKLLGVKQVMPEISVGTCEGKIGFFMEKAEGNTAYKVHEHFKNIKAPVITNGTIPDVTQFGDREMAQMRGTLARGLNDLMWTDWLTGQMDRHSDNYLVDIGKDGTAHVKGIDNDAAFPDGRMGLRTFRLKPDKLDTLLRDAGCKDVAAFNAKYPDHQLKEFKTTTGVPVYEINAGDNPQLLKLVGKLYGLNSVARPPVISEQMYEKLMAMENFTAQQLNDVAQKMMGVGFTDAQVKATASRLKEMIEYAKTLGGQPGRVVKDADWTNPAALKQILAKNDNVKLLSRKESNARYVVASWDYFTRDFATSIDALEKANNLNRQNEPQVEAN